MDRCQLELCKNATKSLILVYVSSYNSANFSLSQELHYIFFFFHLNARSIWLFFTVLTVLIFYAVCFPWSHSVHQIEWASPWRPITTEGFLVLISVLPDYISPQAQHFIMLHIQTLTQITFLSPHLYCVCTKGFDLLFRCFSMWAR